MAVKHKLKEIRMQQYMMSQTDFAKMIGISISTYNNLESGRNDGKIETALIIAKALNLNVEDIWHLE